VRIDPDGQLIPLVEQFLLALDVVDGGQLVLRLRPLALLNQLLDLLHLRLSGKRNLVVSRHVLFAEQHGSQAVERVTGPSAVHRGAEPAEAEQCRRDRPDNRHRRPAPPASGQTALQGVHRLAPRHQPVRGGIAHVVAPSGQQVRQLGVARVRRIHRLLGRQGVDEPVGAGDGVQRLVPV
jgi:hypothetical protein